MKHKAFYIILSVVFAQFSYGQQQSYFDNAVAYNRLLLDHGGKATVERVGNFKVNGTSLLYGKDLQGEIFKNGSLAYKGPFSYNTYLKEVEIMNAATKLLMAHTYDEIDSFRILKATGANLPAPLTLISSRLYKTDLQTFFIPVIRGEKYTLLKEYASSLEIVSTNYVQSDLREYRLNIEYFYADNEKNKLKKIHLNKNRLKKEFEKFGPGINDYIDNYSPLADPEKFLIGMWLKMH